MPGWDNAAVEPPGSANEVAVCSSRAQEDRRVKPTQSVAILEGVIAMGGTGYSRFDELEPLWATIKARISVINSIQ